jgi:hypothetical protein
MPGLNVTQNIAELDRSLWNKLAVRPIHYPHVLIMWLASAGGSVQP